MSSSTITRNAEIGSDSRILCRLDSSVDQPTRAGIAIGGVPEPSPSRLLWWDGEYPALDFSIHSDIDSGASIRVTVPPGAVGAILSSSRVILTAEQGPIPIDFKCQVDGSVYLDLVSSDALVLTLGPGERREGRILNGPVQWIPGWTDGDLRPWNQIGLSDYSGIMRYRTSFVCESAPAFAELSIGRIDVACRIWINGAHVADMVREGDSLDVASMLRPGTNVLEVSSANTLANYFRHLPSPYSDMQPAGGGIGDVRLNVW